MRASNDPEVLERFHAELALVDIVARQVLKAVGRLIELDDLLSAGREGLLDAARRFDEERNVPFRAYANYRVRGAMYDAVRRMAALPRRAHERLAALEAALLVSEGEAEHAFVEAGPVLDEGEAEQALEDQLALMATASAIALVAEVVRRSLGGQDEAEPETPEQAFERAELFSHVEHALAELKPLREAQVVRLHYLEGLTMEVIAEKLDIDRSWASRLHTRAIGRLMKRLQKII